MDSKPEFDNKNRKSTLICDFCYIYCNNFARGIIMTFYIAKSLSRTVQKLDNNNETHCCRSTMKIFEKVYV